MIAGLQIAAHELNDESVAVVIGSGAGGAVLARELCGAGKKVVLLEAGPHYTTADYRNDEMFAFQQLTWLEPRSVSGTWSVARTSAGFPAYQVKAVGGTTNHWGALAFRIQAHELRARSHYGAVAGADLVDWPISCGELSEFWSLAEARMGVTGTNGNPLLPQSSSYKVLYNGAQRVGYHRVANDRHAINSRARDGRSACLQLGFCGQGCKSAAKWSTLYTEIPAASATGFLDLRVRCTALQIQHNPRGKATAVLYADERGNTQLQKAALVVVAANAVETPRLLLNSASNLFPNGLANGSGYVGRCYMKHVNASTWGLFEKPVHMNRGTTMSGTIYDEARHDPKRSFAGGYLLQGASVGIPFLTNVIRPDGWGTGFTRFVENYDHLAGIWLNGEDLPRSDNRVTLHPTAKDRNGLAIPNVHVDEHPNDVAMRDHFYVHSEHVLRAAGAVDILRGIPLPASHNMGTCRMSHQPSSGVTNSYGRTHEIPNLYVCDGSLFPSSSAENPTLTIVALALRQARSILRSAA